jgi:hypothetical protein
VIVRSLDAGLDGCVDAVPGQRMQRAAVTDRQRSTGAVVLAFASFVVLRALEVRKHIVVAPAGKARGSPLVVVRAVPADIDHRVVRTRAAQHASPREVAPPFGETRLGLAPEVPVETALPQLHERKRRVDRAIVIRWSSLDQRNLDVAILAKSSSKDAASKTSADDHVVENDSLSSLPARARKSLHPVGIRRCWRRLRECCSYLKAGLDGAALGGRRSRLGRHTRRAIVGRKGASLRRAEESSWTAEGASRCSGQYDRYGHLMPGNEDGAAALLDAYLERANTRARLAAIDPQP